MNKKNKSHFTLEDRMKIVHEYESSDLTLAELNAKYGIKGQSVIANWRSRLRKSKKSSTFAVVKKPLAIMSDPERQEKDRQIAELERKLHQSEMRNLALNTLIDIAEEQGIQIRKKSGAKQ